MAKAPDGPKTVQVVVHPRRSVMYSAQIGTKEDGGKTVPNFVHRTASGGEIIEVSQADAAYLRAHGFLHETNAPVVETQTGQSRGSWSENDDPRPTINGDDGTVVRGG